MWGGRAKYITLAPPTRARVKFCRFENRQTPFNIYFINSPTETPIAFAILAIVASVGLVFPFSILLTKLLGISNVFTISPWDMPFLVLIRFKF